MEDPGGPDAHSYIWPDSITYWDARLVWSQVTHQWQKVAQKAASKAPKPNCRSPTAAKSSQIGAFSSNPATLIASVLRVSVHLAVRSEAVAAMLERDDDRLRLTLVSMKRWTPTRLCCEPKYLNNSPFTAWPYIQLHTVHGDASWNTTIVSEWVENYRLCISRLIIHCVPQKLSHCHCPYLHQILTDFQNFVTGALCGQ